MRVLWELMLLLLWAGAALFFIVVVAPGAFASLPSRALAGALVGRVLPTLFVAGIVLGAAALVLALGDADRWARWRAGASGAMVGACAIAQFWIGARIGQLRAAIGPSLDALAADDARRIAFGRLHGLSVLALGVAGLAALTAVVLAVAALRGASPAARS